MLRYAVEQPIGTEEVGNGKFTVKVPVPALAHELLKISEGDYVVRQVNAHLTLLAEHDLPRLQRFNLDQMYYTLGEPAPLENGFVLVPFTIYAPRR